MAMRDKVRSQARDFLAEIMQPFKSKQFVAKEMVRPLTLWAGRSLHQVLGMVAL